MGSLSVVEKIRSSSTTGNGRSSARILGGDEIGDISATAASIVGVSELFGHLRSLNNAERLEIIEAATNLIRADLCKPGTDPKETRDRRLREAALAARDLYEPGGALTEWADLDAEDFAQ
jgi:hypothetical protein